MNGNSNTRRGFLKGFGLLSAVAAGASVRSITEADSAGVDLRNSASPVLSTTVDQSLEPTTSMHLALMADNRPREAMRIDSNGMMCMNVGNEQPNNVVKMSVGKDNRLWIQVDDQWRRVALEG